MATGTPTANPTGASMLIQAATGTPTGTATPTAVPVKAIVVTNSKDWHDNVLDGLLHQNITIVDYWTNGWLPKKHIDILEVYYNNYLAFVGKVVRCYRDTPANVFNYYNAQNRLPTIGLKPGNSLNDFEVMLNNAFVGPRKPKIGNILFRIPIGLSQTAYNDLRDLATAEERETLDDRLDKIGLSQTAYNDLRDLATAEERETLDDRLRKAGIEVLPDITLDDRLRKAGIEVLPDITLDDRLDKIGKKRRNSNIVYDP